MAVGSVASKGYKTNWHSIGRYFLSWSSRRFLIRSSLHEALSQSRGLIAENKDIFSVAPGYGSETYLCIQV